MTIDGSTMVFFPGIFLLVTIMYLAIITPTVVRILFDLIRGDPLFISDAIFANTRTRFQVAGVTCDTKEMVIGFFKSIKGKVPIQPLTIFQQE